MDRIRSLPRWAIGMFGGLLYAALWWGAVLLAFWLALRSSGLDADSGAVEATFDSIALAMFFVIYAGITLVVAHATWIVAITVVRTEPLGRRIAVAAASTAVTGTALPLLAAALDAPLDRLLLLVATAIIPGVAAWWLAGTRDAATGASLDPSPRR